MGVARVIPASEEETRKTVKNCILKFNMVFVVERVVREESCFVESMSV